MISCALHDHTSCNFLLTIYIYLVLYDVRVVPIGSYISYALHVVSYYIYIYIYIYIYNIEANLYYFEYVSL
jgi:hypothetical protein